MKPTPQQFFPNMALLASSAAAPSEGIFIPLSDLGALNSAEADPTTGDGREVARALLEKIDSQYNAIAPENLPANMTSTKQTSAVGNIPNGVRQTFTMAFTGTFDPNQLTLVNE